jgi:glycosyltransferase involved in cell wall biosynthesis
MTLSALYVVRNEEDVLRGSIERIHDFVDEIVFVDMQSTDKTAEIAKSFPKVKYFSYPYREPVNMGEARTFSLQQATGDWFLQIDADEYYTKESMEKIREAIQDDNAYSIRVKYYNVAWRWGYVEPIEHYPDRLYRREVVEKYYGVLPLDMTIVKEQYRSCKYKGKGIEGVLEYDNPEDRSFEHPRQPIRKDIVFYHLARARGYNFEYNKRLRYEKFIHPTKPEWENERNTRWNQWVNGMYKLEPHDFPKDIPKRIMPSPKVSIIIPNYNYGQYIKEAIESSINQTYKPHEVIVVDDGSSDDSCQVVSQYPVNLIQQANSGVAHARNKGIEKSTGDYFICLDADDKLHPQFIEKTLAKMQEGEAEIVFTDMEIFGDISYKHKYPEFSIEELRKNQIIPSACALVDRRCADPYGIFDPTEWYEDYGFWLRMAVTQGYRFKQVHEPLFQYRRKQGSRIAMLDQKQAEGFKQLNERYGKII